ncbi:MAG: type VI secretion lipoprotein TssJ [Succinivibrionaceae bacterium]
MFTPKKKFWSLALMFLLASCSGCSSQNEKKVPSEDELPAVQDQSKSLELPNDYPPPPASSPDGVNYSWSRSAIAMEVYSTSVLNVYEGRSHNLMICIYQVSDKTAVNNKINAALEASGTELKKLLSCENFDDSVVSARRFFIRPKMHSIVSFDREKGVKAVVLVAGYNNSSGNRNILLRDIPLLYTTKGIIFKDDQYTAGPLKMRIFIGPDRLQDLVDGEKFTDFIDADSEKILRKKLDEIVIQDMDAPAPGLDGMQLPQDNTPAEYQPGMTDR